MKLDSYLGIKGNAVPFSGSSLEDKEIILKKVPLNIDNSLFDVIEFTKEEIDSLLLLVERPEFKGSELFEKPALPEFKLGITHDNKCSVNSVVFKKSTLPVRKKILNADDYTIYTPKIDAYYYVEGELAMIMGFGISTIVAKGLGQVRGSYNDLLWVDIPEFLGVNSDTIGEQCRFLKLIYLLIQDILKNRPTVFTETSKRRLNSSIQHKKKNNKKKKKNKVKTIRTMFLNKEDFNNYIKAEKQFTCPCWGVIGHTRVYKSGKTAWIAPYKKGKERNKPNSFISKEYQLMMKGEVKYDSI